jgi:hypothetical protein
MTPIDIDCRQKCKNKFGGLVGGRVATLNDKGVYGYSNQKCKCTCVFPPEKKNNSNCTNECGSDPPSYCYYNHIFGCIKNKGILCE